MQLNPPPHTQHNEGVGGCNGGNTNAAIRHLWMNINLGGTSNTPLMLRLRHEACTIEEAQKNYDKFYKTECNKHYKTEL